MLWDMMMMASIWVIWKEMKDRIFNLEACSVFDLLDSILLFVEFSVGNLSLLKKRRVDVLMVTYVQKKYKGAYDGLRACASTVPSGAIVLQAKSDCWKC